MRDVFIVLPDRFRLFEPLFWVMRTPITDFRSVFMRSELIFSLLTVQGVGFRGLGLEVCGSGAPVEPRAR